MILILVILFLFVVWMLIKYKIDKFSAQKVLINAIVMSYKNGGKTEVRYHVSNSAIHLLIDMFGGQEISDDRVTNTVTFTLPLPKIQGSLPQKDNVILFVTMTQSSENRLLIQAKKAKGFDAFR